MTENDPIMAMMRELLAELRALRVDQPNAPKPETLLDAANLLHDVQHAGASRAPLSEYLTVDEAADLLRVDRKVLYREVEAGRVKGVKRIGRVIRIRRAALLTDDDRAA